MEIDELRTALNETVEENELLFEKSASLAEDLSTKASELSYVATMMEVMKEELEAKKPNDCENSNVNKTAADPLSNFDNTVEKYDAGNQTTFDLTRFVSRCSKAVEECSALRLVKQ